MPEPSLPTQLGSSAFGLQTTSPLPTPPSSKSVIPTRCFPSPTSVADVANSQPISIPNRKQPPPHNLALSPPSSQSVALPTAPPSNSNSTITAITTTTSTIPSNSTSPLYSDHLESVTGSVASLSEPDSSTRQSRPSAQSSPAQVVSQFSDAPTSAALHSQSNAIPSPPLSDHDAASSSEASAHSDYPSSTYVSPPRSSGQLPFYFPHLANPQPSTTLLPVSKTQFIEALQAFTKQFPPNQSISDPPSFVASFRRLLDHLDALAEQLLLKHTNALFQALSTPPALDNLLFLLSDISATSEQAEKDVRKAYRYPHLITAILANGNMVIRDAFIAQDDLVHHLLSFLDGDVPLHPPASELSSSNPAPLSFAKENNIIVVNVVQILVSYLDTDPEPLLLSIEKRPSFLPALVKMLHIGAVPKLFVSLIPETSVHQLTTIDHAKVSFHTSLTSALNALANASIFHRLGDAFIRAAQTIFSYSDVNRDSQEYHRASQVAHNITDVYDGLVAKFIRAIRINPSLPACQYLNVYANPSTADTLAQILRAATHLFRETGFQHSSILSAALSLTLRLLRILQYDMELRVASVIGPPPPLTTEALEACLRPVLRALMSLLIDLVGSKDSQHSTVRLHIVDVFVEINRVGSPETVAFIHRLRFGEVLLKLVIVYSHNSLLHHVACRAVEDALVSRSATRDTAYHWLVRSALPRKIMTAWYRTSGTERWRSPKDAQEAPFLSALVHMASCIHHWIAMENEKGHEIGLLPQAEIEEFQSFWAENMAVILANEIPLGGAKPRRRGARGGSMGMSLGLGGSSGRLMRWSGAVKNVGSNSSDGFDANLGAHLVRSDSAHRFGFVEPVSSLRSRFDDVFVEGEDDFGECGSVASLFDIGDGVG